MNFSFPLISNFLEYLNTLFSSFWNSIKKMPQGIGNFVYIHQGAAFWGFFVVCNFTGWFAWQVMPLTNYSFALKMLVGFVFAPAYAFLLVFFSFAHWKSLPKFLTNTTQFNIKLEGEDTIMGESVPAHQFTVVHGHSYGKEKTKVELTKAQERLAIVVGFLVPTVIFFFVISVPLSYRVLPVLLMAGVYFRWRLNLQKEVSARNERLRAELEETQHPEE